MNKNLYAEPTCKWERLFFRFLSCKESNEGLRLRKTLLDSVVSQDDLDQSDFHIRGLKLYTGK